MMMPALTCPVDTATVNENKVRVTAAIVLLLTASWFIIPNWIIPAFLVIDFVLRSGIWSKYSPLGFASRAVIKIFPVKEKKVNAAPKKFAVRIGTIFTLALLILTLVPSWKLAFIVAGILCIFAFLESALGFCAGCYLYTFYRKLSPNGNST